MLYVHIITIYVLALLISSNIHIFEFLIPMHCIRIYFNFFILPTKINVLRKKIRSYLFLVLEWFNATSNLHIISLWDLEWQYKKATIPRSRLMRAKVTTLSHCIMSILTTLKFLIRVLHFLFFFGIFSYLLFFTDVINITPLHIKTYMRRLLLFEKTSHLHGN